MLIGLDHVVVLVPELDRAIAAYEALGFVVQPGGKHSTGTHNALIGLADGSYIELLAFMAPNPHHRWWAALERGGGLSDVCVSTDSMAAERARFEQAGIPTEEPRAMSRTKPDGTEISWQLAVPLPPLAGAMPFLIEDLSPIALRRPPAGAHSNGIAGISRITWAARDLAATAARYEVILGRPGEAIENQELAADGVRFWVGGFALDILTPAADTGPLVEHLAIHGEAPYSLELESMLGDKQDWDPAATLNARIRVVPRA